MQADILTYDTCCDHGYVGLGALKKGCPVIFNDVNSRILSELEQRLNPFLKAHHPECQFLCSPAELIDYREPSQVVIAGVGNQTISAIVERLNPEKHQLILAIQQRSFHLREQLRELGWRENYETLVREGRRFREILRLGSKGRLVQSLGDFPRADPELKASYYSYLEKDWQQLKFMKSHHTELLQGKLSLLYHTQS